LENNIKEKQVKMVLNPRLKDHWAEEAAVHLAHVLFELDPMSLAGHGCPENEYEPESLLIIALLCDAGNTDTLLQLPAPPAVDKSETEILEVASISFERMFGRVTEWSDSQQRHLLWGVHCALNILKQ
jgi:hypothetical protein